MMIISFAWTTDAFLANRKTETRRDWNENYAKRFKKGDMVKAYDRQPRFGGKQIGSLQITKEPYYQHISKMPESAFEFEGFAYMQERGIKIWGKNARQAFDEWRDEDEFYWVIEFEKFDEVI